MGFWPPIEFSFKVTEPRLDATKTYFKGNAADGTMRGSGATVFNANATGKMAFLSNTVAIFKEVQNKDGSAVIRAWEWK